MSQSTDRPDRTAGSSAAPRSGTPAAAQDVEQAAERARREQRRFLARFIATGGKDTGGIGAHGSIGSPREAASALSPQTGEAAPASVRSATGRS
ncbi:MAG: hypothetical protein H0S85_00525 [Desulfovibrionaceae bacterium]|jgi:hypothetical protein|nr:hypothetical protein [Desulfovibrionaceae bacterium]